MGANLQGKANLSDWFENALADAKEQINGQVEELAVNIEDFASRLPHCEKGTCMCPATRYASYRSEGNVVMFVLSCDRHGQAPEMQHPQADLVRVIERTLRMLGRKPWWQH